ncbi:hypothetical protein HXX01_03595 [Candidatus Nomurabacteria bacterium]|nr:hypothetical protein [Candidatus Nomurabacteria bacterium]
MRLINNKIKYVRLISSVPRNNKGYAILFTIVVVGIISMIAIGLSNAAYKQMVLSSVAKDSTTAFYQADIASECALYADSKDFFLDSKESSDGSITFPCAGSGNNLKYSHLASTISGIDNKKTSVYELSPQDENIRSKCSRIKVTKTESDTSITTKVEALGYNICNKSNLRTVERAIEVNY